MDVVNVGTDLSVRVVTDKSHEHMSDFYMNEKFENLINLGLFIYFLVSEYFLFSENKC